MKAGSGAPGSRALLSLLVAACLATTGCWIERRPGADEGGDGAGEASSSPASADLRSEMAADLDSSAAAWNRGDLEGFLASYIPRSTTTYVGSSGLVVGFQGIRGRYAPLFREGADRDSLEFRDLRVRPLEDSTALAIGRYVLHRADSVTSTGVFTLVVQRRRGEWMIVHDHSSAVETGGG